MILSRGNMELLFGRILNAVNFKYRKVKLGESVRCTGFINIFGGKDSIEIGNQVILRSGLSTNPLGGARQIVFCVPNGGFLKIGDHVGITNSCFVATKGIIIDDNVLIGGDCKLYDTDFHSVAYESRRKQPDTDMKSGIIHIEEGVWLGAHVIVCKGVTIGKRSVIGAGSVVTHSIPDDELWAGNPARFIRKINIGDSWR